MTAQNYQINPKVLLVTLQKDKFSYRRRPHPKTMDWATGYAVCDSCSMTDPGIQSHRGFGMQVDNGPEFCVGITMIKTNLLLRKRHSLPALIIRKWFRKSWATAFLYTYTRAYHGKIFGGFGRPGCKVASQRFAVTVGQFYQFGSFKTAPAADPPTTPRHYPR